MKILFLFLDLFFFSPPCHRYLKKKVVNGLAIEFKTKRNYPEMMNQKKQDLLMKNLLNKLKRSFATFTRKMSPKQDPLVMEKEQEQEGENQERRSGK